MTSHDTCGKNVGFWSLADVVTALVFGVQGMVDPGEVVTTTVRREFIEEAMNSLALSEDDQRRLYQQISDFFKKYSEVGGRKSINLSLSCHIIFR